MRNSLKIIICICLTFGCKNQNPKSNDNLSKIESEVAANEMNKSIESETNFINADNFKFFKLDEYDLRDWYQGKMTEELKSLTMDELEKYFQNDRVKGENIYPENFRYFSIQKNTKTEKIITIIESDESCCSDMHLLIYDEKNKLISDNVVAGTGGDGMWYYNAFGKFLDDSTYQLIRVDFEKIELKNDEYAQKMDSSVTLFRFYKDQNFRIIDEKKFEKQTQE